METKYNLYHIHTGKLINGIIISESAKEDFKEVMGWTEKQWKFHTLKNNKTKDVIK